MQGCGATERKRDPVDYIHIKRKSEKGIRIREGSGRQPTNLLMGTNHTALFRPKISWM